MPKFDSLEYSNELRKAGFTEEQANLQAKALSNLVDDQLLTKQDLKEVETEVNHNLQEMEINANHRFQEMEAKFNHGFQELKRDIKELELRLLVRLTGITTLIVSGVGALFRFFPMGHP